MSAALLPVPLGWTAARAARDLWSALPRTILAGLPVTVTTLTSAVGWLVLPAPVAALTLLPLLLAVSMLASAAAANVRGERERVWTRPDTTLAVVATASAVCTAWLVTGTGAAVVVGSVLAATSLLVLPSAFAYGAVRGRRGLAALRGGAILSVARPGLAVSTVALAVLGAFAVLATAGVLLLIVPAYVVLFLVRGLTTTLGVEAAAAAVATPHPVGSAR